MALRVLADGDLDAFATLVLDEFHERTLDVDLLLALALRAGRPRLAVMSAAIAGERIAGHVGGAHLRADDHLHPVRCELPRR